MKAFQFSICRMKDPSGSGIFHKSILFYIYIFFKFFYFSLQYWYNTYRKIPSTFKIIFQILVSIQVLWRQLSYFSWTGPLAFLKARSGLLRSWSFSNTPDKRISLLTDSVDHDSTFSWHSILTRKSWHHSKAFILAIKCTI